MSDQSTASDAKQSSSSSEKLPLWKRIVQWGNKFRLAIVGLIGFVILVLGGIGSYYGLPSEVRCSLPIFTSCPKAEPMPVPGFNVVVAGFGAQDASGRVTTSTYADGVSDTIYGEIATLDGVDNHRGPDAPGVGHILAQTAEERAVQAANIANELNAAIVIYGIVRDEGNITVIEPSFHINGSVTTFEPEMTGNSILGSPLELINGSTIQDNFEFDQRVALLRSVIQGLDLYLSGNYSAALVKFEAAIAASPDSALLYIFAGNTTLRLIHTEDAIQFFDQALALDPNYARALVGRGSTLFTLARTQSIRANAALTLSSEMTCTRTDLPIPTEPQLQVMLAINCYEQAWAASSDPQISDIDIKVQVSLGQAYEWLMERGGPYRAEAEDWLRAAIHTYRNAEDERKSRLSFFAGHALALLGRLLTLGTHYTVEDVCEAMGYYEEAIQLLREDAQRVYNGQAIESYEEQKNALDIWLGDTTCPL
ncbi:MAG: hypothetical protein KC547_09775 [Anaerolineae bacterium]|nr:hypothetical protein [Anaerolineae bacterium]